MSTELPVSLPDRASPSPRHMTLSEYVLNEVRQQIVLGQLAPGSRIAVDQLAEQLGSSRIPVREAIRQLEAEGLLVSVPRRGVMVREVRDQDIEDAYQLLEAAELLVARRAAEAITPAHIERMHHWVDEMLRLHDSPASAEMLMAHRSFHFVMFDAVGPGLLLRYITMLWHACERFVVAAMSDDVQPRSSVEKHRDFIAFLEAQDVEGLIRHIQLHLQASRERARRQLAE